jgi:hypothetical protein
MLDAHEREQRIALRIAQPLEEPDVRQRRAADMAKRFIARR